MTKKRKAELDLDVERNLHSSFVTAANSISHLFTQAIQQNKKAQVAGAQQALVGFPYAVMQSLCLTPLALHVLLLPLTENAVLARQSKLRYSLQVLLCKSQQNQVFLQERQIGWLLKEYGNAQYIPMNVLLAHLQQEIQVSS